MPSVPFLIFSDLDGTLLDHDTYRADTAKPVLAALKAANVPVILASSKTAAEMIPLRDRLGLSDYPMICENGAGRMAAGASVLPDRTQYKRLRALLSDAPGGFEGFGDMSIGRIVEVTGLSAEDARLAATRAFSEPGLWRGDDAGKAQFLAWLEAHEITARAGGRFLTLSFGATKADHMADIAAEFGSPPTLALGDAPNDLEMLETADFGVIIANPHRAPLPPHPYEATGRITRSSLPGPAGWAERVETLLPQLGITI